MIANVAGSEGVLVDVFVTHKLHQDITAYPAPAGQQTYTIAIKVCPLTSIAGLAACADEFEGYLLECQ